MANRDRENDQKHDIFTIGGRTYELVPFLREEDNGSVSGSTMVKRAKELNANLGEEDGTFILEHQDEIPEKFREKFLVFTAWQDPSNPQRIACLCWNDDRWYKDWFWIDNVWNKRDRLMRHRM